MVVWESGYLTQRLIRSQGGYIYEVFADSADLVLHNHLYHLLVCAICGDSRTRHSLFSRRDIFGDRPVPAEPGVCDTSRPMLNTSEDV